MHVLRLPSMHRRISSIICRLDELCSIFCRVTKRLPRRSRKARDGDGPLAADDPRRGAAYESDERAIVKVSPDVQKSVEDGRVARMRAVYEPSRVVRGVRRWWRTSLLSARFGRTVWLIGWRASPSSRTLVGSRATTILPMRDGDNLARSTFCARGEIERIMLNDSGRRRPARAPRRQQTASRDAVTGHSRCMAHSWHPQVDLKITKALIMIRKRHLNKLSWRLPPAPDRFRKP